MRPKHLKEANAKERKRRHAAEGFSPWTGLALGAGSGVLVALYNAIIMLMDMAAEGRIESTTTTIAMVASLGSLTAIASGIVTASAFSTLQALQTNGKHILTRTRHMRKAGEASAGEVAALLRAECDIRNGRTGESEREQPILAGCGIDPEALRSRKVREEVAATLSSLLPEPEHRRKYENALLATARPADLPEIHKARETCCAAHAGVALEIPYADMLDLERQPAWQAVREACHATQWPTLTPPRWEGTRAHRTITRLYMMHRDGKERSVVELAARLCVNWDSSNGDVLDAARTLLD